MWVCVSAHMRWEFMHGTRIIQSYIKNLCHAGRALQAIKAQSKRPARDHDEPSAPPSKRQCVPFITADTLLVEQRLREDKASLYSTRMNYETPINYIYVCTI